MIPRGRRTDTLLGAWPVVIAALVVAGVLVEMFFTNAFVILTARRVEWLAQTDLFDSAARADAVLDEPVAPVPLRCDGVGFGYRSARDTLADVDLSVEPGEFVAVVGPAEAARARPRRRPRRRPDRRRTATKRGGLRSSD